MIQNSAWSVGKSLASVFAISESSHVIAWARDIETGKPVYIMELDSTRRGSNCGCECASCGLPLVAVNAAKLEYRIRPHFRHPDGAVKSDCMYLSARLAALELLRTQGFILLPKVAKSGTAVGISGTTYGAWVERAAERVAIRDFNFRDRTAAVLTLDDGRKLRFELFGNGAKKDTDGGLVASIQLNLSDPAIAGMSIDELRSRISLIPDGMCWLSHWDDEEISAEAKAEAEEKADNFMDLQSNYADELDGIEKIYRHETVLHWEVKNILAESMGLRVPALEALASGSSSSGIQVQRQWIRDSAFIPLLSVQTEKQLGSVIPDVIAKTKAEHGGTLLMEVTVTNRIDPERLRKIKQQNLPALEIDLSRSGGLVSRSELKAIVVDGLELKKWLHHPELAKQSEKLDDEVAVEVERINDAVKAQQARIRQVQSVPIQEIIKEYLDAVTELAEFDVRDLLSSNDLSRKASTRIRLEEASEKLAIRGYPEAREKELNTGRQGVISRILSIKLAKGVGYKLSSTMEVMNAIKQSSSRNSSNHTIYMIAEKVYRSANAAVSPDWYVQWVNEVKRSLRAEELTYERDRKFDRFLSLLFPEMDGPLSKQIRRTNVAHSGAEAQIRYNMQWWANNLNTSPTTGNARSKFDESDSPDQRPSTPRSGRLAPELPNLYAEMKGRAAPRKPKT